MYQGTHRDARYWIEKLQLRRHPEGGYFRETYRAALTFDESALPPPFHGSRSASTGIYYLLEDSDFSAFHRIASDEMWHFYAGDTMCIHQIEDGGRHVELKLGPDPDRGELLQAVVPAGRWFACCLAKPDTFALLGCTVSPGFDFADFEMADRAALVARYPEHKSLVERLTRKRLSGSNNSYSAKKDRKWSF